MSGSFSKNASSNVANQFKNLGGSPSINGYTVPSTYKGEQLTEFFDAGKVTCTNANQVYDLAVDTSVINGTNNVTHGEIQLHFNGFADVTGTADAVEVRIYQTNDADGTAIGSLSAGSTLVYKGRFSQSDIASIPVINSWNTRKFKMSCATANQTFNYTFQGAYYTPQS